MEIVQKRADQIGVGCGDLSGNEKRYVLDVLATKRLSYGPYSKRFEEMMAEAMLVELVAFEA